MEPPSRFDERTRPSFALPMGATALLHLRAQIDGLERQASDGCLSTDLARFLGRQV